MESAHHPKVQAKLTELLSRSRHLLGEAATARIEAAAHLAIQSHEHQVRKSDDLPYSLHPLTVADYCLQWGLHDQVAVCAALLHDAIEDAPPDLCASERILELDPEIFPLVEALSKIRNLQTGDGDLPATYQRILSSSAKDLRILLVKTFDVLHNAETLEVHTRDKMQSKAGISLIYVGVARRLGILDLADCLTEILLPCLMPNRYKQAVANLAELHELCRPGMERLVDTPLATLRRQAPITDFALEKKKLPDYFYLTDSPGTGRLRLIGLPVYRLRLMVESDADAWQVLGATHALFGPLPRHIRDYLNAPRVNGFRAITSRILWEGQPLSLHIVRQGDQAANRLGVLAEWGVSGPDQTRYRRLLATLGDSDLRMSEVYAHVLPDLLDVYSPKGDRFTFPVGAVAVDFAYLIHTELGETCIGAKINGIPCPPEHPLEDGDVVTIQTSEKARPQRAWLEVVKTARARTLIKQALRNPDLQVKGVERSPQGRFAVTSLTSPDLFWSTCCLPTPDDAVVGKSSGKGEWLIHRADCTKLADGPWSPGDWRLPSHPVTLNVTFLVVNRSGALLAVVELLTRRGINSHAIQGKGHSESTFTIHLELGGKPPHLQGALLKELNQLPSVQGIQHYSWRA